MPLIRPSREADIPALTAIYAHHVLHSTGTFETEPPSAADMTACRADVRSRQAMRQKPEADNCHMLTFDPKNKTVAAWLAFIFGQFGLHRFYLFDTKDIWAWLHPALAAFGWWGVYRVRLYGQDDQLAWLLVPLLGFTLAGTALTAIYYGLTTSEKWNAQHNPSAPQASAGNTNWLTIFAVVFALLFGTIALMSSIAFSFQRYFEYQVVIAPTLFTSCNTLPPDGANFSRGGSSKNCRPQNRRMV